MTIDNSLKESFNRFKTMRKTCVAFLDKIENDKFLIIPEKFNNNLYWQTGHILTVTGSLLYLRTNQKLPLDEKYLNYFAKGTSPKDFDSDLVELDRLKHDLKGQIEILEDDLVELQSLKYDQPIIVSTGHELNSFVDALAFLSLHEAYHYSAMKELTRFI